MDWYSECTNGDYPEGSFLHDPNYYHRRLFEKGEAHRVLNKTNKAVLFETPKGRFWVPKALLRGDLVHKNFVRSYLPTPEEMFK